MPQIYDAIIVGAGLAGLACARRLQQADKTVLVVEQAHRVGGRVCTDVVNGFRLDHGFQVLNSAYVNAQALLDFDALELGEFLPGARIFDGHEFHELLDPLRAPTQLFKTLFSNIGTLKDKLKILSLRRYCAQHVGQDTEARTALELLQEFGFSTSFIKAFFHPFYGGIFLENKLGTSAAVFIYTFDRFSRGVACLPADGMGAIPHQLAATLTACEVKLNTAIVKIEPGCVYTPENTCFRGRNIILATPFHVTDTLLGQSTNRQWKSTRCIYFASVSPPTDAPVLMLNGGAESVVNLVCVPSNVTPSLAPSGQSLICVSLNPGYENTDLGEVRAVLKCWFGEQVDAWRHLKTYHVPHALPSAKPGEVSLTTTSQNVRGYFICGDHCSIPTIDHAFGSGIAAAEAVLHLS